jgi:hypothetical protein
MWRSSQVTPRPSEEGGKGRKKNKENIVVDAVDNNCVYVYGNNIHSHYSPPPLPPSKPSVP